MNNTAAPFLALGLPLVTIPSIGIVIGTVFTILCIIRYVTQPDLRTHFTYIVSCIREKRS
jgi:hypothetical protein